MKFGIDRKRESELVIEYQQTGDPDILNEVFTNRVPTIRFLASKYHFVAEDMDSEFKCVFMKSVLQYANNGKGQKSHKSFNTYFYTAVINHVANMLKGKNRKKRTTMESEMNPESVFVRMDDDVDGDGEGMTYHDVIPDESDVWMNNVDVRAVTNYLASRSWILVDFFTDLMNGSSSMSRRREYSGSVKLSGQSPEDAIKKDVGLPSNAYSLIGKRCDGDYVNYSVVVSSKKCIDYLRFVASAVVPM
jgi:hypothetical protein